ncbi:MAG: glutathione S-transferase family protein [Myxococcota bacterium]
MSDVYRVFGSENSPYSVKTRSYFRYKQIPHEWIVRNQETTEEYKKYARLPIVPAVATPDDQGLQDSTPIIEAMEGQFLERSIHPADPTLRFLSELIEEFSDEWGNKWMFHFRWAREVDQRSAARRLVEDMLVGASEEQLSAMADQIRERMIGRVGVVGSNETTAPVIEQSYKDGVVLIENHLASRPYLFGGRPSLADFGLGGQLYAAWTDPTAGGILKENAPATCSWIERMLDPSAQGDFEAWDTLADTLEPILAGPVRIFLTWSDANAKAIAEGADSMAVDLDGQTWTQSVGGPQKYHAKSLKELRRKYSELSDNSELAAILERTGCLAWLKA